MVVLTAPPNTWSLPPGSVLPFAGATVPPGFLACDGSSQSTTTFPALFAALGYAFGGSGSSFNVPDMRGRFPIGVATSGTGSSLGASGGSIDHDHGGATGSHAHGGVTGAPSGTATVLLGANTAGSGTHTHAVASDTAPIGTDNPPFLALNWIIKT